MQVDPSAWGQAALGGALIGLASALLLYGTGRVVGISGVLGGLLDKTAQASWGWRSFFFLGLIGLGVVLALVMPEAFFSQAPRSPVLLAIAGLLVGFGTQVGNGCTSGHGICGLSRFSKRSLVAVMVFMGFGMLTATLTHALGG